MVTHKGSHGTTKVIAEKIKKDGFKVSGGQFVSGAYFWLESYLYVELAIGWYKYRLQRYKKDEASPECAVIIAELSCKDEEFIDLERQDFVDRLAKLAESMATPQNNDREIFALYAYAINELERIGKISFKLFLLKTPPPDEAYCPRYKRRIFGYPTCVIARSNKNISIKDINHIKRV